MLWKFLATLFAALVLASCSSPDTTPPGTDNPNQEPTELACESEGYPCTFAEVERSVIERSIALAEEAADMFDTQTGAEVLAWLAAQPGVVAASGDFAAVQFRLEGGRPTTVLGPAALGGSASVEGASVLEARAATQSAAPDPFTQATSFQSAPLFPQGVTGKDQNEDGKINNRDERRALVLSPFQYAFGADDEGALVASMLENAPGYAGNVVYLANQDASLSAFTAWADYDVVHVATHGSRYCVGEDDPNHPFCWLSIVTGELATVDELDQEHTPGLGISVFKQDVGDATVIRRHIEVDVDFFRANYGGTLENTLVFFNACETMDDGDSLVNAWATQNLRSALFSEGVSNELRGWTEVVPGYTAFDAAQVFYESLSHGFASLEAGDKVRESGLSPFTWEVEDKTVTTELFGRGTPMRIREVVTLLNDGGAPLTDGANLSDYIDGQTDDGSSDTLRDVPVQVDGVLEDQLKDFKVHLELDGKPVGGAVYLTEAEKLDEYSYKVLLEDVPLGVDLKKARSTASRRSLPYPRGARAATRRWWSLKKGRARARSR